MSNQHTSFSSYHAAAHANQTSHPVQRLSSSDERANLTVEVSAKTASKELFSKRSVSRHHELY